MIIFEDRAFKEVIKVKCGQRVWSSSYRTNVLIRRERDTKNVNTRRKDNVETQ